ncbi:hypothetical protein [Acuticoccus yangtzensis]|uniref:hypothetical protein n=1 Tax=Acuticoccus yangtzensis TaxID=1443441 RepID=UPI000A584356|nr:hypothetical protein [Acuticoccus yangtzensis]
MRKYSGSCAAALTAGLAAALLLGGQAAAQNQTSTHSMVERAIIGSNPCSDFPTLRRLEDVEVGRIRLDVVGDTMNASVTGSLTCATGKQAPIAATAGMEIAARAEVGLADCAVRSLSVEAQSFHGTGADILRKVWEPVLRPLVEAKSREAVVQVCKSLTR